MSLYLAQFAQGFDYTAMYLLTDRRDEPGETKVSVFTISFIIRDNRLIIFII